MLRPFYIKNRKEVTSYPKDNGNNYGVERCLKDVIVKGYGKEYYHLLLLEVLRSTPKTLLLKYQN